MSDMATGYFMELSAVPEDGRVDPPGQPEGEDDNDSQKTQTYYDDNDDNDSQKTIPYYDDDNDSQKTQNYYDDNDDNDSQKTIPYYDDDNASQKTQNYYADSEETQDYDDDSNQTQIYGRGSLMEWIPGQRERVHVEPHNEESECGFPKIACMQDGVDILDLVADPPNLLRWRAFFIYPACEGAFDLNADLETLDVGECYDSNLARVLIDMTTPDGETERVTWRASEFARELEAANIHFTKMNKESADEKECANLNRLLLLDVWFDDAETKISCDISRRTNVDHQWTTDVVQLVDRMLRSLGRVADLHRVAAIICNDRAALPSMAMVPLFFDDYDDCYLQAAIHVDSYLHAAIQTDPVSDATLRKIAALAPGHYNPWTRSQPIYPGGLYNPNIVLVALTYTRPQGGEETFIIRAQNLSEQAHFAANFFEGESYDRANARYARAKCISNWLLLEERKMLRRIREILVGYWKA
jgi:hypothetical protein